MRVLGLGGGVGASRLWTALFATAPDVDLTLVVNTGEDLWAHGLRVCPDLDTTVYALSGRQDTDRGWGVRAETWQCMDVLGELDGPQWFNLGDRDLGLHLFRTGRLRAGASLTSVTAAVVRALGVPATVLPMSDDEVTTTIVTAAGDRLHYQEFFVRQGATAEVAAVEYIGAAAARPAPGVLDAIRAADLVVLAPSNPLASLGPVLAVPGVREAVQHRRADTVAVSSHVRGVPLVDPGDRHRAASRSALLAAAGVEAGATGVARLLADVAGRFVLDAADADEVHQVAAFGYDVTVVDTLVHLGGSTADLVKAVLGPAHVSRRRR